MSKFKRRLIGALCSVLVLATIGAGPFPAPHQPVSQSNAASGCASQSAVTNRQPVHLLENSFEPTGAQGALDTWVIDASLPHRVQTVNLTEAQANSGLSSVQLENHQGSSVLLRSPFLPTLPQSGHHASVYVFNELGSGWLYLEFWSESGQRVGHVYTSTPVSGAWQRLALYAISPSHAVSVTIALYGSSGVGNLAYFDDARLTRSPRAAAQEAEAASAYYAVDSQWITHSANVALQTHSAAKHHEPVLSPELPWEYNNVYVYGTVLYDDADCLYKMWYITARPSTRVMFATSTDGINWHKPPLGLVPYDGSDFKTNIVGELTGPASIIRDERETDPERRYKMLAVVPGTLSQGVYFSPDGLRWTPFAGNPVMEGGDVATVFFDEQLEQFVSLTRMRPEGEPLGERLVGISYSPDFENWSAPRVVLAADASLAAGAGSYPLTDIYGMSAVKMGGAYVGFPWVFDYRRRQGTSDEGPIDVRYALSTDLENWQFLSGPPAISLGPEESFDSAMVLTANQPLVVGDEVWFYYGGLRRLHGHGGPGGVGLARWRLDGFVSLEHNGDQPGIIETAPLTLTGSILSINAVSAGALRVEIIDDEGQAIRHNGAMISDSFTGDLVRHHISWGSHSDLTRFVGQNIRLRFHLENAELFSFRFDVPQAAAYQTDQWGPR